MLEGGLVLVKKLLRGPAFYLVLLVVIILAVTMLDMQNRVESIPYPQLLREIESENISRIRTVERTVVGVRVGSPNEANFPRSYDFQSFLPSQETFLQDVRAIESQRLNKPPQEIMSAEFSFAWDPQPPAEAPWWVSILPFVMLLVLFAVFWFVFMQQAQGGGNRVMSFGKSRAKLYNEDKNKITFNEVAGAEEEKDELKEIVDFLKSPKKYIQLGARIPKGVLLIGPPGTGKTLLAKAVAGEAGVPFFSISGSDFVEMFVGVGASRVRDLFDQAKKSSPCIVFIDEIDAVGRHRGAGLGGGHDEREQTLNQLLVEMDGFSVNEGIIVVAATNRADILDPALLRPGRFDRRIVVGMPDVKGREAIIKVHSRGKPLDANVDMEILAKRTPGFTGADIENMMNEAAILTARNSGTHITMLEVEEAITRVLAGPEKKSRIITSKDKKLVAYHEAGHALVSKMLPNADQVHQVSIIPRGMAGGYTLTLPKEDKYFISKSQLEDEITQLLAGRVAEELVLNDISTGASNDLQRASHVARKMVTEYGMSEAIGPIAYGGRHDEVFLGKEWGQYRNYSEEVASNIDEEIRRMINVSHDRAEQILRDNIAKLHKLAETLIEREKLEFDELEQLFANA